MSLSPVYQGRVYDPNASQTPKATGKESGMGQASFLKMFTTQLTNQNPLNPMDNTEFTAQLATFSQLEQLQQINDSMKSLDGLTKTINQSMMANLLGKNVTVDGDTIVVNGENNIGKLRYKLDQSAAKVRALVINRTGSVVADVDLGPKTAGIHEFQWDGATKLGKKAKDGAYRISLVALDRNGKAIKTEGKQATGLITGYAKGSDGKDYLMIGDTAVPYKKILAVEAPDNNNAANKEELRKKVADMNKGVEDAKKSKDGPDLGDVLSTIAKVGGLAALLI